MTNPLPATRASAAFLALGASSFAAAAQEATIVGRVTDAANSEPLVGAMASVAGGVGAFPTDEGGRFVIPVSLGRHSVLVSLIGYETRRIDGVVVGPGGNEEELEVALTPRSLTLNPIVVTVSRNREKALEAPASVSAVSAHEMARLAATVPAQHVRSLPGIDAVRTGLNQHNIVARGFNDVMSGSLLTIVDNRYARIPSLRFNAHNMIPTADLDVERIEVSLGPAAALYGPNAASGVMHIVTASPLDRQGSTVSLVGGERTVFHGQFRTARSFGEHIGIKVSGQYFRGRDFEYEDPLEVAAAGLNPDNPLIGNRFPMNERYSGDVRLDWRLGESGSLVVASGTNFTQSSVELTEIGAAQAENWRAWYAQARVSSGRLFAQVFHNGHDAGDSYLLRTGERLVDRSIASGGQVQHGFDIADGKVSLTYGWDVTATVPRTAGTINGLHENDDNQLETGGYLHSVIKAGDKLDIVAATRIDYHDRMRETNVSPRLAFVVKPYPDQNFRATFNRAFTTPTTTSLFIDLGVGSLPLGPRGAGYQMRGRGGVNGFSFQDRCEGGLHSLCMRSPLVPGQLPANGAVVWNALVDLVVPERLRSFLLNPGAAGDPGLLTTLQRLDLVAAQSGSRDPLVPLLTAPTGTDSLGSTIHNTVEIGYKGIVGGRLSLSTDLYAARIENFVGTLRVETPNVFLDPQSVENFVLSRLDPLIQRGEVSRAGALTVAREMSLGALGTVAPDGEDSSDLVLTSRNFGEASYWGADFAVRFIASSRWRIDANYSYMNQDCFDLNGDGDCNSVEDMALNAPRHKGSIGVAFEDPARGISARLRTRASGPFPMNSGVFVGDVSAYAVLDGSVRWDLSRWSGTSVSLTGTNILDNRHREFVGAPDIGRLLLLQLRREF